MNNIIKRLLAEPRCPLCEEAAETITRLEGEARVMLSLLSEALAVLEVLEFDDSAETECLDSLKDDIKAVVLPRLVRGMSV